MAQGPMPEDPHDAPRARWYSISGPKVLSGCVAVLLVIAGLSLVRDTTEPEPLPSAGRGDSRCWRVRPAERAFAKKINRARRSGNRGRLSLDPELSKVARRHTKEMVRHNTLYHTSSTALRRRVVRWNLLGENVGVGVTPTTLHKAFMRSPGHRANIMRSNFRHSGVGVRKARGRMWVTVIFEAVADPGTRLRMPRC
jgi:uncharacterized protein YkwD